MVTCLPDLLRDWAGEYPERVALEVAGGDSLTFRQWDSRASAVARALVARGISAGDRVALIFDNRRWTDYAVSYAAVHKAGAVAVPLGPRFATAELAGVIEHCQASAVISAADMDHAGGTAWQAGLEELENNQSTEPFQVPVGASHLAEILYTSGTTGAPKGVACSHGSIVFYDLPSDAGPDQASSAVMLHAFPVGTNAGQECLRTPLRRPNTRAVVLPVFHPELLCTVVEELGVNRLQLVPAMAEMIVSSGAAGRHDVSSVERVVLSSAPVAPALLPHLAASFPQASLWNAYALTESGSARTLMRYDQSRPRSVGRPVGEAEMRVVDEAGDDLAPGEVGEIWLRRKGAPRREYYNDPASTAAAFAGDWLRTGDLGFIDSEGYLYVVDRKKDIIISGGANVSSLEVENLLYEHPAVLEAAVFAKAHPVLGQEVVAAVVARAELSERDLQQYVRSRLAEHKVPRQVFFVDSLPRNASGKVLKAQLRETFAEALTTSPAGGREVGHDEPGKVEQAILAIWRDVLRSDDIGTRQDFFDLGGNSLAALQVVARINERFSIDLPLTAVFEWPTVEELASVVEKAPGGPAGSGDYGQAGPGVAPAPRSPQRSLVSELPGLLHQVARLKGWAHAVGLDGAVPSVVLRDPTGQVRCVPGGGAGSAVAAEMERLAPESAIEVLGAVVAAADQVEVAVDELVVSGPGAAYVPVDETSPLEERMDWRFLDLRRPRNRLIFEVQTTIERAMREVWARHGFIEIHSPKIKPTPNKSGSELFSFDHFGRTAYLAQSPQFYKQMAMAAGFERVFEIGPVFRAQPVPTARHDTEFTSIDVEMSWIDSHEDVMAFEETLLHETLVVVEREHGDEIARHFGQSVIVPALPFPRVTLDQARRAVEGTGCRVDHDADDLDAEGERRLSSLIASEHGHEFVFVTDYPEGARPFYHMLCEDGSVASRSFDLLWKGLEVTSGAQREHRYPQLVEQARRRGMAVDVIAHYLDFFKCGCPPHGGFGIGLTRMLMSLLGLSDVREVTYLFRGPDRITP